MPGNRKAATEEILKWVDKIIPGAEYVDVLRTQLERMSDSEFDGYMAKLETGEEIVPYVSPNLAKEKIDLQRNLAIGKELGYEFFQSLILTDPLTGVVFKTPQKYMVLDLPLRRQQQLLIKKISVPNDNRHIDEMTGQPAGDSHGASFSLPEISVTHAQSLDHVVEELIKFRGGDSKAFRTMTRDIIDTGSASMEAIKVTPTRVKSTETLSTLLKAAHIQNNLIP